MVYVRTDELVLADKPALAICLPLELLVHQRLDTGVLITGSFLLFIVPTNPLLHVVQAQPSVE